MRLMAPENTRNGFLSFALLFVICCDVARICSILGVAGASTDPPLVDRFPLIIAHRGSSGVLPEHTVAAYRRAVEEGADYIECDVTLTKDLVPVCLHDNWLSETTDVGSRSEFINRRRNRTLISESGQNLEVNDWFAVDFTLSELKTLRTKQRFDFRDQSHNGRYPIPTLEEHLQLIGNVGTYPELKHPQWINSLDIMKGRKFEDILLDTLSRYGCKGRSDPCIIQSFSEESLIYISNRTNIRLAILLEYEVPTYKLVEWSQLGFYAVGPWLNLITNVWTPESEYKNWINSTTDLVKQCHQNGLVVHAYTFRNEDRFLPWDFGQDINKAYDYYISHLEVDGYFTDFPETLSKFRNNSYKIPCHKVLGTSAVDTITPRFVKVLGLFTFTIMCSFVVNSCFF